MIGAPGEDVDGHEDAGMAHVYLINRGPEDEPLHDAAITVDQSEAGGTVEAGDEFGFSVAASYLERRRSSPSRSSLRRTRRER